LKRLFWGSVEIAGWTRSAAWDWKAGENARRICHYESGSEATKNHNSLWDV